MTQGPVPVQGSAYLQQRLERFLVRYSGKARHHRKAAQAAQDDGIKRRELGLAVAYEHICVTARFLLAETHGKEPKQ